MSSNSSSKQQELKHIASIVRALVTSRKPPCYMRDILREYPEVESKPLPYRNLGYKSAQELLEDTGEFMFNGNRCTGDAIITAKFNRNTAHIASMVRGQKTSKATHIAPVKPPAKQPLRMPVNRSYGFGDRNNNNSSISNNYNNRGGNNVQQFAQQQRLHQTQQNNQLQRQKSIGSNGESQPKDLREMLNSKKNQKIHQTSVEVAKQNQTDKQQQIYVNANPSKQSGPRAILGASKPVGVTKDFPNLAESKRQNNSKQPQQQSSQSQTSQNTFSKPATTLPSEKQTNNPIRPKQQQRLNSNQNTQQQTAQSVAPQNLTQTATPTISNASLSNLASRLQMSQQQKLQQQDQLKLQQQQQQQQQQQHLQQQQQHLQQQQLQQQQMQILQQQQKKHQIIQPQALTKAESTKPVTAGLQSRLKVYHKPDYAKQPSSTYNQYSTNVDNVAKLIQYCSSRNFPPPRFQCMKDIFGRGKYTCRVDVHETIFSTYPNEYESAFRAKEACAEIALAKMQEEKKRLPSCSYSDTELLDKLYTELLNHPHGIFAKNFPDLFETTFKQTLPDNWWALIQTSSLFTTETGLNKVIILANKDADTDVAPLSAGDKKKVIQIDPIRLPWSAEYWNILITHCSSSVEVWGRLLGNDHNVRFEALMNDTDAYMNTKKERPIAISRKHIYLVCINECWHRVRVEELDKSKGSALCFFIDFGDADWLMVDQLYICETHFLRLPAQAVPFSLYGLEDFDGNPFARKCLDDLLPNKCVVGKIFTKESEFYDTNSKFHGKIQVVLFDTSTPEDINLNDELSNMICKETLAPELNKTALTNVIVTHVSDVGDIFLQIKTPELKYVQTSLLRLISTKLQKDQHKIVFDDFKRSSMFLVCDDSDGNDVKWYRASLADVNAKPETGKYLMCFIDHGISKVIDISKIYLLESLSMAISNFPAQAIKVRLHNIPDITKNIVGRIRGLLPKECEAMTKLAVSGTVPLVTIYTRLEGPDSLCTINDVIRIEHELEGCSELHTAGAAGTDDANPASKFSLDLSKGHQNNASSNSLASPSTPTSNAFIDVTRGLTLTTVPGSPQKANELPKLGSYEAIPSIGDFFEVRVTMSANPSNFTIQPYKHYPDLIVLMKELQEFCGNNDEFIPSDMVEVGEAFAAKNPDGYFHRVTVVKKFGDMIHVSFCDFGDIAVVESSQLKTLPLKLRQLPKMAIQAKLHGIKAKHGDWTLDDCLFFRKLTVGQNLVSVIKNITYDNDNTPPTQILELQLIDVTTEEDVFIHEILINENRAIKDN